MTAPIQTNKPVFFDKSGEVLKNGYIYIGQPNQDPVPVANRKTVTFQDSGGSQFTASQPLRTGSDGRIVNPATGKATIALVDGNYSMLTQNVNQQQQDFIPLIEEATGGGTSSNSVVYASLLADLKLINVTPGQYVENIGKTSAMDGEGAHWLVVSNTGNPADDIDLIDFANGTQGQRVENQLYSIKNLQEIEDAGSSAQVEAQDNLNLTDLQFIADAGSQVSARGNIGASGDLSIQTEVFSGPTASSVNLSTLPGGYPGDGIYLVIMGGGPNQFATIYVTEYPGDPIMTNRVIVSFDLGVTEITYLRWNANTKIIDLQNTSTGAVSNIEQIFKLG